MYHPLQNHYTHKLLFSNYIGRYSYSFRARQELISLQLQFCGSDGNMSLQLQFGTVTEKMVFGMIFENYSYSYIKKWFSN